MVNSILFIGPKFYGYEHSITKELSTLYNEVYYLCEYPLGSINHYSIFEKIFPFLVKHLWKRYEQRVLNILGDNNIKNVLIIRGASLPESLMKKMSDINGIKMYHYQWDSTENNKNSLMLMKYCDRNYTFDMADSEKYPKLEYLPLFYDWSDCQKNNLHTQCDVLYFGSWSDKRLELIGEIESLCDNNGLGLVKHIYMPFQTYIRKLFSREHVNTDILSFKKVAREDYFNLLLCSKAVIDVPSPTQRGSTMRSIEALSLKKKVITTNVWLKKESFYHPQNILFYPEEKERLNEFMNSPFFNDGGDESVLSLNKWLHTIVCS